MDTIKQQDTASQATENVSSQTTENESSRTTEPICKINICNLSKDVKTLMACLLGVLLGIACAIFL